MNKYQEALDRLKSIDLDIVLDKLDYDVACDVSVYGIHDYPMLEIDGDIKTMQELVDKETPKKLLQNYRGDYFCRNCLGLIWQNGSKVNYCAYCGQKLDWD